VSCSSGATRGSRLPVYPNCGVSPHPASPTRLEGVAYEQHGHDELEHEEEEEEEEGCHSDERPAGSFPQAMPPEGMRSTINHAHPARPALEDKGPDTQVNSLANNKNKDSREALVEMALSVGVLNGLVV